MHFEKESCGIIRTLINRFARRERNLIKVVLLDIDNTLLSFSGYVKEAMRDGFSLFGLKPYTEDMFTVFERINNSLWGRLEEGTLTFEELVKCRWNLIFKELGIDFDGIVFEEYFQKELFYSAVPEDGAEIGRASCRERV